MTKRTHYVLKRISLSFESLFWTTLHWQLELFDLVLFFFFSPSLSPRRPHTSCRKGQATPFWPLVLWAFWQAFENDRVRQLLRVFSNGAYPAAFWSQHGKDNLSVFGWLTLNSSKICFVTHSPCPRGLARFPKLFPHSFSSHPRKKKQCFAKNKLSHFSKKDCCCSGIFKPQEFTSGLILANTARCAARNVSCWPPSPVPGRATPCFPALSHWRLSKAIGRQPECGQCCLATTEVSFWHWGRQRFLLKIMCN